MEQKGAALNGAGGASAASAAGGSESGASALAALGYTFVAGPSGSPSDFVLRQVADPTAGFAWKGQENFTALGKAVFVWSKEMMVSHCGLEVLRGYEPALPFATPGLADRAAPVLVLITGDVPGGDAGTWSRRLCINDTTKTGAMFEYIARAQAKGWSVVVPDVNGSPCPHAHMSALWAQLLKGSKMTKLLIVGHSYGGPVGISLLKSAPDACERLGAIVTTDGMGWHVAGWDSIEQVDETVPTAEEVRGARCPIPTSTPRQPTCSHPAPRCFPDLPNLCSHDVTHQCAHLGAGREASRGAESSGQ